MAECIRKLVEMQRRLETLEREVQALRAREAGRLWNRLFRRAPRAPEDGA